MPAASKPKQWNWFEEFCADKNYMDPAIDDANFIQFKLWNSVTAPVKRTIEHWESSPAALPGPLIKTMKPESEKQLLVQLHKVKPASHHGYFVDLGEPTSHGLGQFYLNFAHPTLGCRNRKRDQLNAMTHVDLLIFRFLHELLQCEVFTKLQKGDIRPRVFWSTHKYNASEDAGDELAMMGANGRTHFYVCLANTQTLQDGKLASACCVLDIYHTTMWFSSTYTVNFGKCYTSRLLLHLHKSIAADAHLISDVWNGFNRAGSFSPYCKNSWTHGYVMARSTHADAADAETPWIFPNLDSTLEKDFQQCPDAQDALESLKADLEPAPGHVTNNTVKKNMMKALVLLWHPDKSSDEEKIDEMRMKVRNLMIRYVLVFKEANGST